MATPGPGLSLIPENGAARTALAQQLVCWSKQNNGQIDPRIRFLTCKGIGYYYIPPEVCTAGYGDFPFTSEGNPIVCNPNATHQMDRTIWPEDVLPIDPNTCTTEGIQLATPSINAVIPGDGQVEFTWDGVPGAENYYVRYKTPEAGAWTDGPVVPAPATTATVSGLTNGQEYMFQVQARSANYMDSFWSVSVSATPNVPPLPTPTALTAGTPTATEVPLSWGASAGATSYHVQYKLGTDTVWTDHTPDPTGTAATVGGLTAATEYNFRVKASGPAGDSAYTAAIAATTAAGGL